MGDPRQPIEDIAAEEIAADEERSRDWVAPKLAVGLPPGQIPADNPLLGWLFQFGAVPLIGALAVLLLVAIGAFALFVPGGAPSVSPTAPAVADATPTATPSDQPPTASPTEPPTEPPTDFVPTPSPAPSGTPRVFAVTDPQVDEELDDGTPVDDPQVDIVATTWQKLPGLIRLTVIHTAQMADPASAADVAYIGSYENVPTGVRPAGFALGQAVQPFHAFLWQIHDGVLTIGRVDPETLDVIAGEAEGILITRDGDTVTFEIPLDQLPPIVDAYQVYTFHRANLDDPQRSKDQTELIDLPEQFRLP